jgi:hypothetical protein
MEVTGQLHTPTAFPLGKVTKKSLLDRRIGGPQIRCGCDAEKEGFFTPLLTYTLHCSAQSSYNDY